MRQALEARPRSLTHSGPTWRAPACRRCAVRSSTKAASAELSTDELKATIVRVVGGTQRGKSATPEQRAAIRPLLEALERRNAVAAPTASPLLSGVWALLYQAPLDEARAAVDRSGTTEGPFLAALQPANKGFVRTKANLQLIDLEGQRAENLAEFVVGGRWEGALNIVGSATIARGEDGSPSPRRVDVAFEAFQLRLGNALRLTVPLTWLRPTGWVETTYLDADLRIGRGDKGSIFVASRVAGGRWKGAGP